MSMLLANPSLPIMEQKWEHFRKGSFIIQGNTWHPHLTRHDNLSAPHISIIDFYHVSCNLSGKSSPYRFIIESVSIKNNWITITIGSP